MSTGLRRSEVFSNALCGPLRMIREELDYVSPFRSSMT